ncbi:hypothetical protein H7849_19115 [Alloacidobacterium dinghuense]|uniref:Uncharacterized protein n=1 Tax=Alloacidobacterium dinghuense TaxID=2763107 RepID=A0A7G8BF67_9BACT|nr:hypothetical protein [Alloacidobacterium dinghuense]QNI31187.1 hypothetical protein H7849_19115 [Alloacidobacterium dinghuense]
MQTKSDNRRWLFALTHWNWKAALITAIFRGAACIAALRHVHPHERQHFSAVEMIYVLLTAGIFSAWQQQALVIKPRYCAWTVVVVLVPLTSLGLDAVLHSLLDHVDAHALGIGALIFTLVSAMFHWHAMESGAMLVGKQSRSLSSDLKQLPGLLLSFVTAPIIWLRELRVANPIDAVEENDLEAAA